MGTSRPSASREPKVWVHASEVVTGAGFRSKDGRRPMAEDLGRIPDGAVVTNGKKILWVGPTSELPKKYLKNKRQNLRQASCILPGLVDCHTHLVFAGDRASEFAARCGGKSYQAIAAEGGGIQTTVRATRSATADELERLAIARLEEAASFGVRTLEIKSGYGLTIESELKVLEVVKRLQKKFPKLTIVPTFLGAHDFPKEVTREDYLRQLIEEMIPQVARKKLAQACDVFVDEGYYTPSEGERILKAARKHGLAIKLHGDELANTESAVLAAKLGALSVDHLLRISDAGVQALAKSSTVAVLLPATAFYLKAEHAPARKLIDAGVRVALSTDFNPGTSMTLNLPLVMTIAALYLKMSAAELICAVTYNGARALGLHARKGTLEAGMDADVAIYPFAKFEEVYYRFGWRAITS